MNERFLPGTISQIIKSFIESSMCGVFVVSGGVLLQGSFFEGAAATTVMKFPSCSTYVATFHHINFAKVKLEVFGVS